MVRQTLKELYEERYTSREFTDRNRHYREYQKVYDTELGPKQGDYAYRPNLQESLPAADTEKEAQEIVVNQVRRVTNHFTAMFAYPPRVMVTPLLEKNEQDDAASGEDLTEYVGTVFTRSNLATLHPKNSHWLSLRGDCVFGIDWGLLQGMGTWGPLQRGVRLFVFDPQFCYPLLSPFDPGGVEDMLISMQIHPETAREVYGYTQSDPTNPENLCRLFMYWTQKEFRAAIEDTELGKYRVEHDLGFCPFRWVYGDPSGRMAQSDVREVPKLQEVFNEGLLLAIDAIRKQVDASWWVAGGGAVGETLEPEPGKANILAADAKVGRWEISVDPQVILGVMSYLEQAIQSTTGVSPISMQGAAPQSSRVSGSAVRHQVEAAEARAETRKALMQSAYARLAEYILYITKTKFPTQAIFYRSGDQMKRLTADKIANYVEAEAEYGGFLGLPPELRVQIALQGLGHLWDDTYAIGNIVDLPGIMPRTMREKIHAYQLSQAKAQAEAQQAAQPQQAEPGQQQQGAQLSRRERPTPPTPRALSDALARRSGAVNGSRPR